MRKTVVVLLTSLLLATLPAQGGHDGDPGAVDNEVERVVHDCTDEERTPASPGNDLSSVWVGTGVRDVNPDPEVVDEQKLVLVDVVLRARDPVRADGVAARLSITMESNNNVLRTLLESPPDPNPSPSNPNAPGLRHDWQDADTILYLSSGESDLEPLTIETRETEGTDSDPLPYRVVELGYRFADIFSPGSAAPPEELKIQGKWSVESSIEDGDAFTVTDVMPGDDPGCAGYLNEDSAELIPEDPRVTGVTATWGPNDDPAEGIDRKPTTKVTFRALMDLGGGDPERGDYTYAWTIKNGDDTITSTDAAPQVRLAELADVDATVTVTDDLGRTSNTYTFSEDTTVAAGTKLVTFTNLPPIADFKIQNDEVPVAGDPVTFKDLSFDEEEDDITSWSWDFGDESTSTSQNPTHTFAGVGEFDVRLTVTDEHGTVDPHLIRVFVCAEAQGASCKPPNSAPQASFVPSAVQVTQGGKVTFTDSSTDRDGTIASWSWDFGDGATSTQQNPEHTFDKVGTFQTTLTVTDDGGLVGTRAVPIRVLLPEPEEPAEDDELLPAPIAAFTVDPEEPVMGEAVRFRDATSSQTDLVAWTWFFGDGSPVGEGPDVTHTYEESGTFRVRLTVTDERGVRDTVEQTVVVGSGQTDEKAPGLPLVFLLAALAAVAARRR